jgi:hypothetical protein
MIAYPYTQYRNAVIETDQGAAALLMSAGTPLEKIAAFDFYSGFPVAVEMACEMLELDEDDATGPPTAVQEPSPPDDRSFLEAFAAVEKVGRSGKLRAVDGRNPFEPD